MVGKINKILIIMTIIMKSNIAFSGECWVDRVDCIQDGETRNINGDKIHKDCWKRKKMYKCKGYADPAKSCSQYETDNNCIIEGVVDKDKRGNWVVNQEIKYGCSNETKVKRVQKYIKVPKFKKEDDEELRKRVKCNEQVRCIDGKCFDMSHEPNEDMGKATSILASLKDLRSSGGFDPATMRIWKGDKKKCGKKSWGAVNCCNNNRKKRLPEGLKLSSCSAQEKELAELLSADKDRCNYMGMYKKKALGIIPRWKKFYVYCCFDNNLALEINKQARVKGLVNRSNLKIERDKWFASDPEEADCRGFTVEELEKMDWSKLSFEFLETQVMESAAFKKMGNMVNAMGHAKNMVMNEVESIKEAVKADGKRVDGEGKDKKIYEKGRVSEDYADVVDDQKLYEKKYGEKQEEEEQYKNEEKSRPMKLQKNPYGINTKRGETKVAGHILKEEKELNQAGDAKYNATERIYEECNAESNDELCKAYEEMITEDRECGGHEADPNCNMTEEKCVEGASVKRLIDKNGKAHEIRRDCWKWQRRYSCRGERSDFIFSIYCNKKTSQINKKSVL